VVGKQFSVPVHLGQFPAKSSFLVGPDNTIRYVYDWLFRPRRHVARILGDISQVRGDS
jgi:peroxiredoxin